MIRLKRDYQALPDTVRGDEAQLQQAFMNLCSTASRRWAATAN